MTFKTKMDLDQAVSEELSIPRHKVAKITSAFIDEMRNAIAQEGGFSLFGLGTLYVKVEPCKTTHDNGWLYPQRIRLYFQKSSQLKKQIANRLREVGHIYHGPQSRRDDKVRR